VLENASEALVKEIEKLAANFKCKTDRPSKNRPLHSSVCFWKATQESDHPHNPTPNDANILWGSEPLCHFAYWRLLFVEMSEPTAIADFRRREFFAISINT